MKNDYCSLKIFAGQEISSRAWSPSDHIGCLKSKLICKLQDAILIRRTKQPWVDMKNPGIKSIVFKKMSIKALKKKLCDIWKPIYTVWKNTGKEFSFVQFLILL